MEPERRKEEVVMRLKRVEGQVRGIRRMVEEGAPCSDILTQVAAATAAIKKTGMVMVQTYLEECLERGQKGSAVSKREAMKDFQKAISRYINWS